MNLIHFSFIYQWDQFGLICGDGSVWELINGGFTTDVAYSLIGRGWRDYIPQLSVREKCSV